MHTWWCHSYRCVYCGTVAGCRQGHIAPVPTGDTQCQDLPALDEEGGDAEDLSLSLGSVSSAAAGDAELLQETQIHMLENEEMQKY